MPGGGAKRQNLVHHKNVVFNPYLDNPLSEIIQIWTRGTIEGCRTPESMPGGGARGQNLVHIEHQYSKGL